MSTIDLNRHTQYLMVHGSRAYGMHTEHSDVDVKGWFFPPFHAYLALFGCKEQVDSRAEVEAYAMPLLTEEEQEVSRREKVEGSIYEAIKFVSLCMKMNPSMIDVLFCREEEVRVCTPAARLLRDNRDLFLNQSARNTFMGYAQGQMKRIRTHRGFLLNPPAGQPERAGFNLPQKSILTRDERGAIEAVVQRFVSEGFTREEAYAKAGVDRAVLGHHNAMELLEAERKFAAAEKEFAQYKSWAKHRNRARAELEAHFGFDTKHAAHLVRLMRMGREIMTTGEVRIWRPDADELLAIRMGEWAFEQLEEWFEDAKVFMREIKGSPLPKASDKDKIRDLFCEMFEMHYGIDPLSLG